MAEQRDGERLVKQAEQRREDDSETHTHACTRTHEEPDNTDSCGNTIAWQLVTAIVVTSKLSRPLALFSVCLYVHTPASPAALICHAYRWLLCHHKTPLFGYDRHFSVYTRSHIAAYAAPMTGWLNELYACS